MRTTTRNDVMTPRMMTDKTDSAEAETVAFVAGATGYTGREVVRALCRRDVTTVAHVRPDSARRDAWQTTFEDLGAKIDLTPWQPQALVSTFERLRPTLVFALLGTTNARAKRESRGGAAQPSYASVDYGLTAMLMAASGHVTPRPRFIYLSAAGLPNKEPGAKGYMHARWRVEHELARGDLPYVAARPSFITGTDRDDNRTGERVGAAVADSALALAGLVGLKRVRERYRSTTNVALADALVRLALDATRARCAVESEDLR